MKQRFFRATLLSAAIVAVAPSAAIAADPAPVATLLEQGRYWKSRGRQDLANQAFRRVLAIDPGNAAARAGMNPANPGTTVAAPTRPKPNAPTPVPAQPTRTATSAAKPAVPKPAAPKPVAPVRSAADQLGEERLAAFGALDRGDLKDAARRFERIIARAPNDTDALGGLGVVRLRNGSFAEARTLLERASRGGRGDRWAQALASARFYGDLKTARDDLAAGRVAQAQATAEQLTRSNFADREPANQLLANIYERQGRYEEASALYGKAAQASGITQQTSRNLQVSAARTQARQAVSDGRVAEAQQLFTRALVLDPNDPWMRYDYARFLIQQQRPTEAAAVAAPLFQATSAEGLYAGALYSSELGQVATAESLIDRIPSQQRTPEMVSFALGVKTDAAIARVRAMAAQGQQAAALQGLRQIAATPGISAAKLAAVASAFNDLGDTASATQYAQHALAAGPDTAESYEPIVRILAAAGQDSFALSAVQRASELAGASPQGQRTVARLNGVLAASQADRLRLAGQYAPAFDLLQNAWNAAPNNVDILSALGRLYQSGGMQPQAARTFQMVLATEPTNRGARLGLIDTAAAAGEYALAEQTLAAAMQANPNDYEVFLSAARLEQARGHKGTALKYLKQAQLLYTAQAGNLAGGFGSANPFAGRTTNNPFAAAAAPAPVNPFALGSGRSNVVYTAPALQMPAPQPGMPAQAMGNQMALNSGLPYPAATAVPTFGASSAAAAPQTASTFQPGGFQSGGMAQAGPGVAIGDPVLRNIQRDMQTLAEGSEPRAEMVTDFRSRSGEKGLSQLKEVGATATVSTGLAGGRVFATAHALALDAGRPTGSGLARFGHNPTAEAQAIVDKVPSVLTQATSQHKSGVALSAGYKSDWVNVDVGTTPLGFYKHHVTGGVEVTPQLSQHVSARVWANRRPVTDSVIAYAGTIDPVTGGFWGAVMKSGGGASVSYDKDGTGAYADGSYYHYDGTLVPDNHGMQFNVGGYLRLIQGRESSLTVGINGNYQKYKDNQNFFSYGQGGYFSPQSFMSVSFPLRYALRRPLFDITAGVTPGFQSYEQGASPLYPTDRLGQSVLDSLKARNADVRARFDDESQSGFGVAAEGSAYYSVSNSMKIGGDLNLNTFGAYNELRASIGIKQSLGSRP